MNFVIASSLLIVCGIINTINGAPQNVGSIPTNKFSQRFQRSIELSLPSGRQHVYSPPIEPVQDYFENVPDSEINSYKPLYWPFKKYIQISQDTVPKTFPYLSIKSTQVPTYESEFNTLNVPSLISEDTYNKYYTQMQKSKEESSSINEPEVAIQFLMNSDNTDSILSNVNQNMQNDVSDNEFKIAEINLNNDLKESQMAFLMSLSPEASKKQKNTVMSTKEEIPVTEIEENKSISDMLNEALFNMEIKDIEKLFNIEINTDTYLEQLNETKTKEKSTEDEPVIPEKILAIKSKLLNNDLLTQLTTNLNENSVEYEQNTQDEETPKTPLKRSQVKDDDYETSEISHEQNSNININMDIPVNNEDNLDETTPGNLNITPEHLSVFQLASMKILEHEPLEIENYIQKNNDINQERVLTVDNTYNEFPTNLAVKENEQTNYIEYDDER